MNESPEGARTVSEFFGRTNEEGVCDVYCNRRRAVDSRRWHVESCACCRRSDDGDGWDILVVVVSRPGKDLKSPEAGQRRFRDKGESR